MSKEQTPITAEEFYLQNRGNLLRSNLGTKDFTIDMMEQYAQAKVLEALEKVQRYIQGADEDCIYEYCERLKQK